MPLTPEDVSNKRFTPVRLREGYDMGEVDQFLDEVEAELARLNQENADLRSRLAGQPGDGAGTAARADEPDAAPAAATPESAGEAREMTRATDGGTSVAALAARPTAVETIQVTTTADASSAAARLLEIATRNAEELEQAARSDAERIVGDARTEADRILSESRAGAEQLEADARNRAQMLDSETSDRRTALFGDLEREKEELDAEVESLRAFEREYRSRLRSYFQQQLEALEGNGEAGPPPGDGSGAVL